MEILFFIAAAAALLATLGVICSTNPMHALLYLVTSLLAVAMIFFMMGANFAGIMEIIVYVGAIMVLFVFVVMMLNLGKDTIAQEKSWLNGTIWIGPGILSLILLAELVFALHQLPADAVIAASTNIATKSVGIALYGPYLLMVELASTLLLAALVTAYHLGRDSKSDKKQ
jgi:NADH-quinone oxidoreductase subunit J